MTTIEICLTIAMLLFALLFPSGLIVGMIEYFRRKKILEFLNENRGDFPELSELVGLGRFWDMNLIAVWGWYRFCVKRTSWQHSNNQQFLRRMRVQRRLVLFHCVSFIVVCSLIILMFVLNVIYWI